MSVGKGDEEINRDAEPAEEREEMVGEREKCWQSYNNIIDVTDCSKVTQLFENVLINFIPVSWTVSPCHSPSPCPRPASLVCPPPTSSLGPITPLTTSWLLWWCGVVCRTVSSWGLGAQWMLWKRCKLQSWWKWQWMLICIMGFKCTILSKTVQGDKWNRACI